MTTSITPPAHDSATTAAAPTGVDPTSASLPPHDDARADFDRWRVRLEENVYTSNVELRHTVAFHLGEGFADVDAELTAFGARVPQLEPLVADNDHRLHYPVLEHYDGDGRRVDRIRHHAAHADVGDALYGTGVVSRLARPGGLREGHAFFVLSSHLGDAGHNCPIVCTYETTRLVRRLDGVPERDRWLEGLTARSYRDALTSSQFLTEVQGGSDVGANATVAWRDTDGGWRIRGEKWFTSNADADLNVVTARYDAGVDGTRGVSLFLVPARLADGSANHYTLRRLKEKLGTRALATAEIDYHDAIAVPLADDVTAGFRVLMEDVIQHSRIGLAVSCLGMATRAYQIARSYADVRRAFGRRIVDFQLVRENLAAMRADVLAAQAGVWQLAAMQDDLDTGADAREERRLAIRLLANVLKQTVSQDTVDHIHHAVDTLAGNGTIETFSSLPRLLRDAVIEENWEGTHNTLRTQVLRDLQRSAMADAMCVVLDELAAPLPDAERRAAAADVVSLRTAVGNLLSSDMEAQPLLVQHLARDIASVFCNLALVREAEHQQGWDRRGTKRAAASYHRQRHLDRRPWSYDADELDRLATVIDAYQ